ncbi:MAG: host attachment protein [Pseudomonadota bacterium]
MKQKNTWVATFDGASCRVFAYDGAPRHLEEIVTERRSGPHKPHFDDRPGRVYSSVGDGRSGVSHHTDPERRMEDTFVAELAEHLTVAAAGHSFDDLIIAASPRALGAFRRAAPKALIAKLARQIHGDYVNGDHKALLAALER